MKRMKRYAYRARSGRAHLVGTLVLGLTMAGCGSSLPLENLTLRTRTNDCSVLDPDAGTREAIDRFILDFTGGDNPIYLDGEVEGANLGAFETTEGDTLQDLEKQFTQDVRDEIVLILCDAGEYEIQVRVGEAERNLGVNVLHFVNEIPADDSQRMGQAEYDPCNLYHDNVAIVYTSQFLDAYADPLPYEDWVAVFANVAAHEICHTLGFSHVARAEHAPTGDAEYVELMLDGHTFAELCRPQRRLVPLTSCPENEDEEAIATLAGELGRTHHP